MVYYLRWILKWCKFQVAKLMSTIATTEIRWKLRQKKVQLPSSNFLHLYAMSDSLILFASDTLTTTQHASSGHFLLRLHLMVLILTCLADVVIFGEAGAIMELFHQHKVLHKCLEVSRDALLLSESDLKVQMLSCLLRVFRVTLKKHANPKVSLSPIESHLQLLSVIHCCPRP